MGLIDQLPLVSDAEGWPWNIETSPDIYSAKIQWPKITIVTPSFNQGIFIEQTIRSVLLQNYPNLEYIIVDGGSSDNTVEIIKKYSKWISYWISEPDKGQSDAINKGLVKSSGILFNWINSDDFLAKECLFLLGKSYTPDKDVYLMDLSIVNSDDSKIISSYRQKLAKDISDTIVDFLIAQPSSFYRLEIIKKIGGIDNRFHFVMDLFLWVRYLLEHGQRNIVLIPYSGASYREHSNTKTNLLADEFENETLAVFYFVIKLLRNRISIQEEFSNFTLGLNKQEIVTVIAKIRDRHLSLLKKNLRSRKYELMFKYFKEYLKTLY